MAWSQRSSDKRWEPEERHAQACIHFQRFAKVAPYEGAATSPKGSFVPKDAVGGAKCEDNPTPTGSVVFSHAPGTDNTEIKAVT